MKGLSRIQRVKNRTKKVISSVKNLICKKYTYIVGWGGVLFGRGLNPSVTLESDFHPPMAPNQVIESVQDDCLYSQLENEFDPQEQDQLQIQTGSGVTLTVYKNIQSSQKDKKVVLAKSPDKPFFPGANAFPVNPPASRPGRRATSGPRINPPGYRVAPKMLPNPQQHQQQAGNKIKNKGNSGKPDKGSNSPEYENTCPSQYSSNEQKPEVTHGEHLRGEVRPKTITSIIDADSGLIRLAEEACNNQRVQDNINHLQDELAKGNDNPGIHKKYLGNNVWEHRARGGGRLYTREIGDKVEILAKSGKGTQNQSKVIQRVKELYINKKN